MDKIKSYLVGVHLADSWGKTEFLFEYGFLHSTPQVGDEIHEAGKVYTITKRFWSTGGLAVEVTDQPTSGIVKC